MKPASSPKRDPKKVMPDLPIYLKDIPRQEAERRIQDALKNAGLWGTLGTETIPLDENAVGRVTSAAAWARLSSPHYHASAMDGYAVNSGATVGASPAAPSTITIRKGGGPSDLGSAVYLDTGDPLPEWADAVVPIENVEPLDDKGRHATVPRAAAAIRIRAAVVPWSHIRPMGEDIVASELILPEGHTLRPADLGALAAGGHREVEVARKPRVAIIPTGTELVPMGSPPGVGDIIEYNSIVLAAQINQMGGDATRFGIVPDDYESISREVRRAARDFDLILLNAGSSAGAQDFSASTIDELGEVLVHGVAVRPGHPVIMGLLPTDAGASDMPRPIIGVPGYPVSAALTIEIFVEPLMSVWLGRPPRVRAEVSAELARKITSSAGDEDHIRVVVGRVGGRLLAAPLAGGAGVITSLVRADGVVVIPPGTQGHEAGDQVTVRLYRDSSDLERTILCIGSHDISLDIMAQFLARSNRRLASSNVGSQGGLLALQRRQAHLAGCHLLDPQTGEYNLPFVRRYLHGMPVKVIALVRRQQGLMVKRGNPREILSIPDLARPDVRYANRQKGAGTRILLDHHLARQGILPHSIRGYDHEVYTHLAVAAAVQSGQADCGLGIAAAAAALNLQFIPLFEERYDLVIPTEYAVDSLLAPLLKLLGEAEFRREVAALPGYDVSVMGQLMLEDG